MARASKLRRSNFCILEDSVLFEMLKTETLILLRQGFHLHQGYDVTRRRDKKAKTLKLVGRKLGGQSSLFGRGERGQNLNFDVQGEQCLSYENMVDLRQKMISR